MDIINGLSNILKYSEESIFSKEEQFMLPVEAANYTLAYSLYKKELDSLLKEYNNIENMFNNAYDISFITNIDSLLKDYNLLVYYNDNGLYNIFLKRYRNIKEYNEYFLLSEDRILLSIKDDKIINKYTETKYYTNVGNNIPLGANFYELYLTDRTYVYSCTNLREKVASDIIIHNSIYDKLKNK